MTVPSERSQTARQLEHHLGYGSKILYHAVEARLSMTSPHALKLIEEVPKPRFITLSTLASILTIAAEYRSETSTAVQRNATLHLTLYVTACHIIVLTLLSAMIDADLGKYVSELYDHGGDCTPNLYKDQVLCAMRVTKMDPIRKRVLILRESGMYFYRGSSEKRIRRKRGVRWFTVELISVNEQQLTIQHRRRKGSLADVKFSDSRVPELAEWIKSYLMDIMTASELKDMYKNERVYPTDSCDNPLRALRRFRSKFFGKRNHGSGVFPSRLVDQYSATLLSRCEKIDVNDFRLDDGGFTWDEKDWVEDFSESFRLIPWLTEVCFPIDDVGCNYWKYASDMLADTTTIRCFTSGEIVTEKNMEHFLTFCTQIESRISGSVDELCFLRGSMPDDALKTLSKVIQKTNIATLSFEGPLVPEACVSFGNYITESHNPKITGVRLRNIASHNHRQYPGMYDVNGSIVSPGMDIIQFMDKAEKLPEIKKLDISGNWIRSDGQLRFASLIPSTLRELRVDGMDLSQLKGVLRAVLASRVIEVFSMCLFVMPDAIGDPVKEMEIVDDVFDVAWLDRRPFNLTLKELCVDRWRARNVMMCFITRFRNLSTLSLIGPPGGLSVTDDVTDCVTLSSQLECLRLRGPFEQPVHASDLLALFPVIKESETLTYLDLSYSRLDENCYNIFDATETSTELVTYVDLLVEVLKCNTGILWLRVDGCWNRSSSLVDKLVNGLLSCDRKGLEIVPPKQDIKEMLVDGCVDGEWVNSLHKRLDIIKATSEQIPPPEYENIAAAISDNYTLDKLLGRLSTRLM